MLEEAEVKEEALVKEEVLKGVDDVLFDANAGTVPTTTPLPPTTTPLPPPLPPTPTSFVSHLKLQYLVSTAIVNYNDFFIFICLIKA